MYMVRSWKPAGMLVALAVAVGIPACGGDDGGGGEGGERAELSFFVGNTDQAVLPAKALIAAFDRENPNIKIKLELGPQGAELDNMVKTRLATQEMTDVFAYNAGSLFQALKPESQLQPVNDEAWVENLDEASRADRVSERPGLTAHRHGSAFGGGILYNKKVYEDLGLEVPEDVGRVHGQQRRDQEGRHRSRAPELWRYVDVAAVRPGRLPHNVAAEDP